MWAGYGHVLWAWRAGVTGWLFTLSVLALSGRYPRLFTGLGLAGVLGLRLLGLGLIELNVDESQWIASAATLVRDPRFWVSVDGTTSGPLNIWPLSLIYYLGFSLDYATLRLWGLLTCVLPTFWLLLATFRLYFSERIARLAILPVAACLALTTDPDGLAFNSEQLPMCLLALAGYWLSQVFTRSIKAPAATWGRLMAAGLALGCLPYAKLQSAPVGVVMAAWVLGNLLTRPASASTDARKQAVWFVAGGVLPTLLISAYSLWANVADYAVRAYLLTNLSYAQKGSWSAGTISWADRLLVRLPQVYGGMPTTRWFWCLTAIAALLWLVLSRNNRHHRRQVWLGLSVFLAGIYATLQPGNPFPHYQWVAFVPGCWLLAGLLAAGIENRNRNRSRWLIGGWLALAVMYPGGLAVVQSNPAIRQLADGGWFSEMKTVSAAIRRHSSPNETMVVWGWQNNLHVETGLLTGSRFIPLYHPVVDGPQQAYFMDVYQHDLVVNQPDIFVDAVSLHPGRGYNQYPVRRYAPVQAILMHDYQLVETVAGAKIYRRLPQRDGLAYRISPRPYPVARY